MRDYCKRAALAKTVPFTTKGFRIGAKWQALLLWLLAISLLGVAICWALQAWCGDNQSGQHQRILLHDERRPVAIVDFWPLEQQVFVVDLTAIADLDFVNKFNQAQQDQSPEQATATVSTSSPFSSVSTIYSLGLGMLFDRTLLVNNLELNQEAIESFLRQDAKLATLVDNDQLWWRFESFQKFQARKQKQQFNCPVAVINATSPSGLAANFSSMIERSQFAVIRKANLSKDYPLSQVIYDENNVDCQNLLGKLAAFGEFQVNKQEQSLLGNYRAKMVIILGEDLGNLHALLVDFL